MGVVGQQHAIGGVEAAGHLPARVAEPMRQLAVDPDLGVVVDHDLEHNARAGRIEVADPLGDRHAIRYQLKHTRPWPRRSCVSSGDSARHSESS